MIRLVRITAGDLPPPRMGERRKAPETAPEAQTRAPSFPRPWRRAPRR